jgi:Zn ribbon nucleic-acid-binding protein
MTVLRARAACPRCSTEEEIWYYKGKVAPTDSVECKSCFYVYKSSDFTISLLELYQNVTITTTSIHITAI